jgi:hypothetical protein
MIAIRPLLASLLLCVIVLAGHPSSAQAQEAPLLKRLYGFDQADPPADLPQIGPIAAAIDGSLVNLMGSESAGPSRLRRFSADGRLLAAWAGTGGHEGRLERPQDVAVTTAGDVWVLDLHWLHRFAADGTWLDTLPWPPDPHAADGTRLADGAGGRPAGRTVAWQHLSAMGTSGSWTAKAWSQEAGSAQRTTPHSPSAPPT